MIERMQEKNVFADLHRNECRAYELFDNQNIRCPIPICYHAQEHKLPEQQGMLLLEDFTDRGACVDIFEGLTVERAMVMADAIAGFQAFSLTNNKWHGLFRIMDREDLHKMEAVVGQVYDTVHQMYPDELQDIEKEATLKLADLDLWMEIVNPNPEKCANVIVHGDCWTNNIIFERKNGNFTDHLLALIDWQLTHPGNPSEDLARLLITAMDPDIRRKHQLEILRHYYERLTKYLGKSPPFSFEDVQHYYFLTMQLQAPFCLMVMPMLAQKSSCTQDMLKRGVRRAAAAIKDALAYKSR